MNVLLKKISLMLPLLGICHLQAGDVLLNNYAGVPGQAPQKPKLSLIPAPSGQAVQAEAVSNGKYQGLLYNLPRAIDLNTVESIEFDWYQTAYRQDGIGSVQLKSNSPKTRQINVEFKYKKWHHVVIKLTDADRLQLKSIYFSIYAAMDTAGEKLAVANLKFNPRQLKAEPGVIVDEKFMDPALWKGNNGGNAPKQPEITRIDSIRGKAIQVKALSRGTYQGMDLTLPEPLNTADIGTIAFDFRQTAYSGDGTALLMLRFVNGNGMFLPFKFKKSSWNHVVVPIDLRTVKMIGPGSPFHGQVKTVCFTVYAAMDAPGETIEVANLRFQPRQQGSSAIKVNSYRYLSARPNSGENSGKTLTDGIVDEKNQIHYDWYTEDPYIEFDLGGLYLVDRIELKGFGVPSQNIAGITVETSTDGKKFQAVANLANKDSSAAQKLFSIIGENQKILGRYIRIKGSRSRTDFPIDITEVTFNGKLPSDEELRAAAAASYNLGPQMPEINDKNYFLHTSDAGSFAICKKSGILRRLTVDGVVIADRVLGNYDLSNGKKSVLSNDYSAKLISCRKLPDGVEITFTVGKLDNITFKRFYGWRDGLFTTRLSIDSARTDRQILQTATEVILPQEIRTGGRYETWGAGHTAAHKYADELTMEMPADTGPVISFESPLKGWTFLNFRYRYADRYVQIGSGTVTVSGYGDKRTKFTDNGWVLGDGLFAVNPDSRSGSIESRLIAVKGDLIKAFDQYLALPDTKKFRSAIKRPKWLKDVRANASGGAWHNMFGENSVGNAAFYEKMVREGFITNTQLNNTFIWGDYDKPFTDNAAINEFGGEMTLQQFQALHARIRKASPKVKLTEYTWLWSASAHSRVYKENPEWFIVKNASGATVSFFPGATNYYRLYGYRGSPSYKNAYRIITDHINKNNFDFWYLDGGGSPSAIDWSRLIIDEPDIYDSLYLDVRNNIRQHGDRGIFFNHPENPLGDMGLLEGSASAFFSDANWRDGASWMYKFKLWQRPDQLFTPIFIYWHGDNELDSLKKYVLGTGLFPSMPRSEKNVLNFTNYLTAYQQTRWAKLVSADITPNWRNDPECKWELMPLTFGDHGHLMIRSRFAENKTGKFSCDMSPLGPAAEKRPVYYYKFDYAANHGAIPEGEAEAAYRATGWQSDFLLKGEFLGRKPWSKRLNETLAVPARGLTLIYVTQSPALVWSVDDMRVQYPMSSTLGVNVSGTASAGNIKLAVTSTRRSAEVIANLPDGMTAGSVALNGQAVDAKVIRVMNSNFVRFAVPQGTSQADIVLTQAAAAPAGSYDLSASAKAESVKFVLTTPAITARHNGNMAIYNSCGMSVWHGQLTLSGSRSEFELKLPGVITGDNYYAVVYDQSGKQLAKCSFRLSNAPAKLKPWVYRSSPIEGSVQAIKPVKSSAGTVISSTAMQYTKSDSQITFDPANAALKLQISKRPSSLWTLSAGAMLNSQLKRYVKVRLESNHADYAPMVHASPVRNVTHCYGDSPSCAVISFDFETPAGFTVRSFASVGIVFAKRATAVPDNYGTRRVPDHISALSGLCMGLNGKLEEHWIDLQMIGAPADWNGNAYVGLCLQNSTPSRYLKLTLLETADTLPAGVKASNVAVMKGGKSEAKAQEVRVPRIKTPLTLDGKLDEAVWKKAIALTDFTMLNAPAVSAPDSSVKLLTDGNMLYVGAEFYEPEDINSDASSGQPWQLDGLEFYLARGPKNEMFDQYIFTAGNSCYAARYLPGKPPKMLPHPQWKSSIANKRFFIEAAIPLKYAPSDQDYSGFNAGRNRTGSKSGMYTLAKGNAFRIFDQFKLVIK